MYWLEALAFGFGVPACELAFAWMEAGAIIQHESACDAEVARRQADLKTKDTIAAEQETKARQLLAQQELDCVAREDREAEHQHQMKMRELDLQRVRQMQGVEIEARRLQLAAEAEMQTKMSDAEAQVVLIKATASADAKRTRAGKKPVTVSTKKVGKGPDIGVVKEVVKEVVKPSAHPLGDRAGIIMEYMRTSGVAVGTKELVELLRVDRKTVIRAMEKLEKSGDAQVMPTQAGKEKQWTQKNKAKRES